ncbi:hypothetical protein ALC56_10574, partial [Trachymyrmex septentrionalis]
KASDELKQYNKTYYDKRHKVSTKYIVSNYVLIKDIIRKSGESQKLKPVYKPLYMVTKVLNNNIYVIQDIPGFNRSQ